MKRTKAKSKPVEQITQSELARRLGTTRQNVAHHVKRGGAPKLDGDPDTVVAAWLEHLETVGREGTLPKKKREKLVASRIRLIDAQTRRVEWENKLRSGELLEASVVTQTIQAAISMFFGALDESLDGRFAKQIENLSAVEIQRALSVELQRAKGVLKLELTRYGGDEVSAEDYARVLSEAAREVITAQLDAKAVAERVGQEWFAFQQWRKQSEAERKANRDLWCRVRAASGLPVPDATPDELAQHPGLTRGEVTP